MPAEVLVWITMMFTHPQIHEDKRQQRNKSYELTGQTKHPVGGHVEHKSINSAQAKGEKKKNLDPIIIQPMCLSKTLQAYGFRGTSSEL